jgi:K+-transporting ATPase ATPase A chain
MTTVEMLKIIVYFLLVLALTRPFGLFMRRVFCREKTFLDPILRPIERAIYSAGGVDETREQDWMQYTIAMLMFSGAGVLFTYALQRMQSLLPLNPDHLGAVPPELAWNTAVSFATNTNWQAYAGESTMSHLTQMAGLTLHNFVSAATGIALAIAFIRGISRGGAKTLGNFWVDLTRATLWVLLPLSLLAAVVLMSQGVVQNFHPSIVARTVEGSVQKLPQGPVASQEAIKMLGTNGGGFFNANSAHPYENPTPFTNLLQMLLIFLIGAGLCYTLGSMTGKLRHGWAIFQAMSAPPVAGSLRRRRQHGREGSPFRHWRLGPVRGCDHGRLMRGGQFHARLVHAVRRFYPPSQHHVRGSHLRRGRSRDVRHAALRHPGSLHRRPDGRAHSRIPR